MPNTKSAKKRLHQSEERRLRNRAVKSSLKTQLRKVREAVDSGELEKATTEFRVASKKLDQAGQKRVIHKNKASRIKSRLSRLLKATKQKAAATS
jgi:small subunit ribosomal protein S20